MFFEQKHCPSANITILPQPSPGCKEKERRLTVPYHTGTMKPLTGGEKDGVSNQTVIPALAAVLLLTVGTLWIFRQGWVGRPVSQITDPQGMELAGSETPWIREILKEGGVLLGSDGPMTTDDSVWYFRQRLERHLDARLEVVRLEGQSYDAWLFTAENGEAWVSSVHGASVNEAPSMESPPGCRPSR